MGRWTYYCPLWLGPLLVLAMNDSLRAAMHWSDQTEWLIVVGLAVAAGLQCQVLMIGAQGAFAQVLPVPMGKSIRGGGAAVAGWLLIAWVGLSTVTVMLGFEAVTRAAVVLGICSLAALAGALLIYAWNLPVAVADFGNERRVRGGAG
jgi:hypothetical protein